MPTVGLLINETKPAAISAARQLTEVLQARGITVRSRDAVASLLGEPGCVASEDTEIAAESDFVVVFGGDGTLLAAARLIAPFNTPLLGVHLGRFGFITEVPPERLFEAVDSALDGRCRIEERAMLSALLQRSFIADGEAPCETLLGMNDVVVASGAVRMVHVQTRIGSETVATYAADGVIVATPTGSTGYSLSAGGPLVHPTAPVFLITPVSPHTLNARPLVIPDTETIHLTIEGATRDATVVSVDGQIETPLRPGDTVSVSRAPYTVRLLTIDGPDFYAKIRSRWHYGERSSG